MAETDVAGAVAAERRLLDPAVRRDRAAVDSLLAPEFSEIGQSGRLWERTELLDAIVEFESSAGLLVTELEARVPAPDLVLLGYVSTVGESRVRRSSLWRHAADRWRVEFHQGTPLSRSV
ncbi:nuclear transport factor 2 family protein [Glaciihabitans sp. INWT7]|nr:nuclear transport factor 2 family protein [Glaciihabitans sp. INWT7]